MPRHIIRPPPCSPQHDKLVQQLAQELKEPRAPLEPLILEAEVHVTGSRHVHVIWRKWSKIPDEERSCVIHEAYVQAEGEAYAEQITIATGLTAEEAVALGLLPWRVVPLEPNRNGRALPADSQPAVAAEARKTLLGARARELRYARPEDAEAARQRLEQAVPGVRWMVEKEAYLE